MTIRFYSQVVKYKIYNIKNLYRINNQKSSLKMPGYNNLKENYKNVNEYLYYILCILFM